MSPTTSGGRYASYKCATARLLAWLTEKEPPTPRTVRAMLNAARRLSERCEMMPADVKASLELAIKLRREVHELYTSRVAQTNPDDERHAHFISALERVRAWLQPPSSKEERRDAPTKQLEPEAEELANRFELLDVEEGWDEVDESVPKSQMLVGKDVLIDGLTSKPELNGRTGYVVEHLSHNGRYKVRCGDEFYSLKPENIKHAPMQEAEQEQFILGEAIEFEAACLMLDVQAALGEVATAWNDYKTGASRFLPLPHLRMRASATPSISLVHSRRSILG
ncbi:hypothetical protein GUITHDRAFT_103094 [Guillardia theta CCMP2712]|uniref:DUF6604 domain-containing protein n=1 Tax=Guillardia theta (strain CCMP2712) TaxID=905079 RepID=L1JSW7_GUITC|nr:hypothetical protein GUITHDRAFT_103094 [Guillardia theta CCMP2712]EKX51178.1 hypothetical protein GUITHDRAFT_103094 [Guillardia theta CCMP2712]|eukprot:XP_005838158.1 hypothetical protein GUITHDRAFT_103094 [Guillardia theta CCMP2712]